MLRYAILLAIGALTGCASVQQKFCGLIEPDSYLLVSVAGCETTRASFEFDAEEDFSMLESYSWMPVTPESAVASATLPNSPQHAWVTDAVNATLATRGFRLDQQAPNFLVSYDVPVEMRGTITVTFNDPDTGAPLWQGTATDDAYRARTPEVWERRIRSAVGLLLEQFPPSQQE